MRFSTVLIVLFLVINAACTRETLPRREVPAVVRQKFDSMYLGVKMLRWKKQQAQYIALFRRARYDMSIVFTPQAQVLLASSDIPRDQLPATALTLLRQKYPGYAIEETGRLDEKGKTSYRAKIRRGMKLYEVFFDNQGQWLRSETRETEDEKIIIDLGFLKLL